MSYSSWREIGDCMTAAAPSAKPLSRSARIEMITTGTRCSAGICLSRSRNAQPSTSGIMMSSVISASGCRSAMASASSAVAACSTVKPSASSCTRMSSADLIVVSRRPARCASPEHRRRPALARRRFGGVGTRIAPLGPRIGIQTVKREPSPTALSTATEPPCSSASSLTIARPSPVPSNFRARPLSTWLNGLNSCSSPSGDDADAVVGHADLAGTP